MASEGREDERAGALAPGDLDLGVEGALVELGDDDLDELGPEVVEDGLEEVVGHGPGGFHALERVDDRGRFGRADVDRQVPLTFVLAEQHDRLVRGNLHSNSYQGHRDHGRLRIVRGHSSTGLLSRRLAQNTVTPP